ncbi:hypothetical protein DKX38_025691 [Salix brachista]|uniref:Uncharacterized protein n=1 Tax=Salix brachista TaxID=2182728 RepID=A0A5N5JQF4_9ROSI|nr:hypothetical protein DKX38_025691 [Salix brachista]
MVARDGRNERRKVTGLCGCDGCCCCCLRLSPRLGCWRGRGASGDDGVVQGGRRRFLEGCCLRLTSSSCNRAKPKAADNVFGLNMVTMDFKIRLVFLHTPSLPQLANRTMIRPFPPCGKRLFPSQDSYRRPKRKPRIRNVNIEESPYFRLKNSSKNHPDNLTEDQLNQIGLGYDYMARYMDKDDPNLKHPYDWYRYGEYGPYSWRGVVVGEPVLGGITDECVTLYSQVKDDAEWDKIEQHEMAVDFGERLKQMNKEVGFRHFWVFVRHPKWRLNEMPWEQWTLVSEVVVEAGKQRLDKWNLMGRLGNQARQLITRCAAWFRPDIIYVKRPVFQCRFEPQDDFFRGLMPFLDPKTERDFLFELENEDGSVQLCTYYEGLCKIVKVSQKAFVDDVVNAYEKMSDERKSECLGFLLRNHPVPLLHPYTKEWKAKLEEMELGCDAPDDDEEYGVNETEYTDEEGDEEEEEENEQYWEKKFKKALSSSEEMENLVKWSESSQGDCFDKACNLGWQRDRFCEKSKNLMKNESIVTTKVEASRVRSYKANRRKNQAETRAIQITQSYELKFQRPNSSRNNSESFEIISEKGPGFHEDNISQQRFYQKNKNDKQHKLIACLTATQRNRGECIPLDRLLIFSGSLS